MNKYRRVKNIGSIIVIRLANTTVSCGIIINNLWS